MSDEPDPIFAIADALTNAEVIEQLARPGFVEYLRPEWRTLDPTYGEGRFWTLWRPDELVACDLNLAKSPLGRSVDFRLGKSGFDDDSFDVVVLDGPYALNGTSTGEGPSAKDEGYGVEEWQSVEGRHALLSDMLREGVRVLRPARRPILGTRRFEMVGGYLMFKCQDQVNGQRMRWQTRIFADLGESLGLRLVAQVHLKGYRDQPSRCVCKHHRDKYHPDLGPCTKPNCVCVAYEYQTKQDHPRMNYSTLLIFRDEREWSGADGFAFTGLCT